MESFNDFCVMLLCNMLFIFSDLTPNPEVRYWIGWFYLGIIGFLICINILVVAIGGIVSVTVAIMRYVKKKKYLRELDLW